MAVRFRFTFAILFASVSILAWAQDPKPEPPKVEDPKPVRTGEVSLAALVADVAKWNNRHIEITKASRSAKDAGWEPSGQFDLTLGKKGQFRLQYSDYWGDCLCYIGDGDRVLNDPLDDTITATWIAPPKQLFQLRGSLNLRGEHFTVFFLLLAGTDGLSALIQKNSAVTESSEGDLKVIQITNSRAGTIQIAYKSEKGVRIPVWSSFDNMEARMEAFRQFPELRDWVDRQIARRVRCSWIDAQFHRRRWGVLGWFKRSLTTTCSANWRGWARKSS